MPTILTRFYFPSFRFSHAIVPNEVKEQISDLMKKKSYNKKDWAITINNTRAHEPTDY